jgi:hypothetical protein
LGLSSFGNPTQAATFCCCTHWACHASFVLVTTVCKGRRGWAVADTVTAVAHTRAWPIRCTRLRCARHKWRAIFARLTHNSRMNNRIFSWCTAGMCHRCANRCGTHHADLRENSSQGEPKGHYDELWFAGLVCLPVFNITIFLLGGLLQEILKIMTNTIIFFGNSRKGNSCLSSPSTSSLTATAFASRPRVQRSCARTNATLPVYLDMKIFIDSDNYMYTRSNHKELLPSRVRREMSTYSVPLEYERHAPLACRQAHLHTWGEEHRAIRAVAAEPAVCPSRRKHRRTHIRVRSATTPGREGEEGEGCGPTDLPAHPLGTPSSHRGFGFGYGAQASDEASASSHRAATTSGEPRV